jgi:peptidoglycan/xylan/chitin deacetylase (PgdA/CDA1 family)
MIALCYHKIEKVENFERQISFLKRHYHIVGIEDFLSSISGEAKGTGKELLLTFDDGDISLKSNVMPVLKRHKLQALAFVITGLIDSEIPFWWDEVILSGNDYDQVRRLKTVSDTERLEFLTEMRRSQFYRPLKYPQLTRYDLAELEKSGIAIASHSHTHPCLDKCESPKKLEELTISRRLLKEWGHRHYNLIAYPNGNYDQEAVSMASAVGYSAGFAFDHQRCYQGQNKMVISRLKVSDNTPIWKLKLILANIHPCWVRLRKRVGI